MFPRVLVVVVPSSGGLHPDLYLRTIYVAQGPYRSPGQPRLLLHQANIPSSPPQQPTKGNQEQSKGKTILSKTREMGNMKQNLRNVFCIYLSLTNATNTSPWTEFWGPGHRQSDWCEGSVGEIGSGRLFCPIPLWLGTRHLPSRTIVYLSCYYSAVTPNWVGDLIQCGEKI